MNTKLAGSVASVPTVREPAKLEERNIYPEIGTSAG